ncbi:MAG TPA: BON domain-containing protein [Gemmatimonadaceae bacterium]|nr:BON domain-containing protein [Gemmatimonadaceae bacterium]
MEQRDEAGRTEYPLGRGYGHDYMRGGEVLGGYGYAAREEYDRPRGAQHGDHPRGPAPEDPTHTAVDAAAGGWREEPGMFEAAQTVENAPEVDPTQPRIPHLYGGQGVLRHSRSFYVTQAQLQGRIYGPRRYARGPYSQRLEAIRRDDGELRTEVEEALFYDTWVDAQRIAVDVEDGVVTLRGTLPSQEEVRYATDDAWEVAGVRGVKSEITVESERSE